MTCPADTEPSAEAQTAALELRDELTQLAINGRPEHERIKSIALALDRFRAAERERCAAAVDCGGPNGCGEWFAKRGRGHKRDNGHCMAHEGYCAHDLAAEIRTGTSP